MRWRLTLLSIVCVVVAASCGGGSTAGPGGPTTTALATIELETTTTATTTTTTTRSTTTTTTAPRPVELAAGLLCRDVKSARYRFGDALSYWVREGLPDHMDDDGDGIPCEPVYAASEVRAVLDFEVGAVIAAGAYCRDIEAAGYGFADALAYWVREGAPDRMDTDRNGLPCETVYSWDDILVVMAFDGAPFASPEAEGVSIDSIAADVQRRFDDAWGAEPDHPAGVLGPIEVTCDDDADIVRKGDVFACAGFPQTEPDFPLDPTGMVFLVLDDVGTVSLATGKDLPDTTVALWALFDEVESGLLCRDLVDAPHPFSTCCSTPSGSYFSALLYWFMDGMPDRMDEDVNGIPCETLFSQDAMEHVWNGGVLADLGP